MPREKRERKFTDQDLKLYQKWLLLPHFFFFPRKKKSHLQHYQFSLYHQVIHSLWFELLFFDSILHLLLISVLITLIIKLLCSYKNSHSTGCCVLWGFLLSWFTHFFKCNLWVLWTCSLSSYFPLLPPPTFLLQGSSFLRPHFPCSCARDSFFQTESLLWDIKNWKSVVSNFFMQILKLNCSILCFTLSSLKKKSVYSEWLKLI